MAIFRNIVIIFLGRNTPNNKFLDVTNKYIKTFTWNRCSSLSVMNLVITVYLEGAAFSVSTIC